MIFFLFSLGLLAQPVPATYNTVEQSGSPLTRRTTINFTGAGVTCVDSGGKTTCTINGGSGSFYQTVQDEGVALTQRPTLNFIGAGVSCVDNSGATRTDCTITSGGGSGSTNRGAFSSRTTCNAGFSGGVYYSTDSPLVSQCNGSSYFDWYRNDPVTLPNDGTFAWVNQGGASITARGALQMNIPAASGDNFRMRCINLPAASNYTITGYLEPAFGSERFPAGTLMLRNSGTGNFVTWGFFLDCGGIPCGSGDRTIKVLAGKHNSPTSFNSQYSFSPSNVWVGVGALKWFRLVDDGTNRIYQWSQDGINFFPFGSIGRTDFTTPDQACWGGNSNNSTNAMTVTLASWTATTP